ncbi:peptide/nickel transport system substrate-binding protein [Rhizobiales bacterium GAS191]|nr:peptide/nickel transport system substrate-binding protein [Rhizobiales bacterium GAS191]
MEPNRCLRLPNIRIPRRRGRSCDRAATPIGIWAATDNLGSSRLALSSAIAAISDLDQQALVAHARQVEARNTDAVLEGRWEPPVTDGSGRDRTMARRALVLLGEAGYAIKDGALVERASGRPFAFEILVQDHTQERLSLIFADSLRRLGVDVTVRLVDEVQYQRRRQKFDFDMLIAAWIASPSPGYEQRFLWGSQSADQEGSYNLTGARSPAIDAMIAAMVAAKTHEEFVDAVRAYDRVLLSGFYIVPLFYTREQWIAYSDKLAHPKYIPLFGVTIDNWWQKQP